MNPPETIDPLDALLQQENAYIADDGFVQRVTASLPRRRSSRWPRFLLFGAAVIGSVAAALWLPWNALPPASIRTLLSLNFQVFLPWLTVSLVVCSLAWAVIAAVQWED